MPPNCFSSDSLNRLFGSWPQVRKLQTIQELYIKFVTELESNHFSEWICHHPQTIGYIKECEIRQQKYAKNLERQFEGTQAYLDHLSLWERLVL